MNNYSNPMKILVTGHKGFIGQHLTKYLSEKTDHELVTYDWKDEPNKLDFDYASLDWIIHLGAISSTNESNIKKIAQQNIDYTIALFDNAVKHNVHFQFASSAALYGKNDAHQKFSEESTPLDLRSPYAWSKYIAEHYMTSLRKPDNIHVQCFRYFNVYGPEHEDHKLGQASPLYTFNKQKEEQGRITLFLGSDEFKRDFIHVSKVCQTHLKFLSIPESGIWNVGMGVPHSFLEIAQSFDCPIEWKQMPINMFCNYQHYTCANTEKLTSTIGSFDDD